MLFIFMFCFLDFLHRRQLVVTNRCYCALCSWQSGPIQGG